MPEVSFLQNFSGTISGNQTFGAGESLGINVLPELQCYLTKVKYYRHSTASIDAISDMQVFKWSSGGALSVVVHPVDDGTVGWKTATLASPLLVPGGTELQLSVFLPAGCHLDYNSGTVPTPPPGFSWVNGHHRMFTASSGLVFCTAGDNSWFFLLDLVFDTDAIVPAPSTPGDVTGAIDNGLADWLSESDATHRAGDGIPWDTWQTSLATKTVVDAIKVVSDKLGHGGSGNDLDWIRGLWRLAGDLTDAEIGLLKSLLTRKDQITGASGGGGSAFFGPSGTQVAAGVEALLARSTNAMVGFPAAPWTMTDETDWGDAIAYAEPADLYVVTFTSTPPSIPDNGRAGVPVRYRLAWWSPLNGSFARERRWIDFENVHLVDPAGRMPGVLLQTYAGGAGHIQAWTLTV